MASFHNSIQLQGPSLSTAERRASTQEERVLEFYRNHPHAKFTPSDVERLLGILITSARRAITNLTEQGYLTKLPEKTESPRGSVEYYWQYRRPSVAAEQMGLFA